MTSGEGIKTVEKKLGPDSFLSAAWDPPPSAGWDQQGNQSLGTCYCCQSRAEGLHLLWDLVIRVKPEESRLLGVTCLRHRGVQGALCDVLWAGRKILVRRGPPSWLSKSPTCSGSDRKGSHWCEALGRYLAQHSRLSRQPACMGSWLQNFWSSDCGQVLLPFYLLVWEMVMITVPPPRISVRIV